MGSDRASEPIAGSPPGGGLHLPTDFLSTPETPFRREIFVFAFPQSLVDELRGSVELSESGRTGRAGEAVWLAAFSALAHRHTQQQAFDLEVTLCHPDAARPETRRVPVRIDGERTVAELIEQASASLTAERSFSIREGGLPTLPVALGFFRSASELEAYEAEKPTRMHHLRLVFVDRAPHAIVYDGGLFIAATIERLAGHLQQLLPHFLREPSCPVARLPLLTAGERDQLLVDWQSGRYPYPALPVHKYVEAHAVERPEAVAVTFNDQHLTYGELNRRANQVAHYLLNRGSAKGARVAVCVQPSVDIAICILGIFKAGATHVPLDPSYPRDRLAVILDDIRPDLILAHASATGNLPSLDAPILFLDQDPQSLRTLPDHPPDVQVGLDQPAFIVYTSGTTGKPKGVVMSHANLVHYVLSARDRYGFGPSEVVPAAARFTFSITLFEVLLPLVAGGRVIVLERDHVLDLARLVRTLKETTAIHTSPSLWRKVLAYLKDQGLGPEGFRNLRHVSSGGDLVSADLVEGLKRAFDKAEVFVIYGCSEIACMGCTYFVPRDRTATRSQVGKPFDNTAVRLADPYGNLVPIGVVGEIYFAGVGVSLGYLNRADLTRERFVSFDGERYYRTGDLGRYDVDGNVEILGRSDFQIKLRGIRIELGDVEATLRQAPGVREAVVSARELGGEEKGLVGYLVPQGGPSLDVRAVRRFLQSKLPEYMVPAVYVLLEAMPVNMNNKLDRAALPAPTAEDLARLRSLDPPRNDRERQLVAIWEDVLNIRPIGVRDDFFDIGGDSLQSVSLMVEIEKAFGKALPLSTVLTAPTIEKVAALLGPGSEDERSPMVLLRPARAGAGGDPAPPIFFVHDGEGEVLPYRNLALRLNPAHPVYGIQPVSRRQHPMMHTRISEIVDDYTARILQVQPKGPYLLSGLCIGGFLAFEIARKLKSQGHSIGAVVLIDAAHVTARGKSLAARRFESFSSAITQVRGGAGVAEKVLLTARRAAKKVVNLVTYETRAELEKKRNLAKMRLFRFCLDHHLPLPQFTEDILVRVVLRFAEKEYVIPARPYPGDVALLRATQKDAMFAGTLIDDTPYVDLFLDPQMEWQDKVAHLEVHDLPGGHSSMLVPPYVDAVAGKFQNYLDRALGALQSNKQAA